MTRTLHRLTSFQHHESIAAIDVVALYLAIDAGLSLKCSCYPIPTCLTPMTTTPSPATTPSNQLGKVPTRHHTSARFDHLKKSLLGERRATRQLSSLLRASVCEATTSGLIQSNNYSWDPKFFISKPKFEFDLKTIGYFSALFKESLKSSQG